MRSPHRVLAVGAAVVAAAALTAAAAPSARAGTYAVKYDGGAQGCGLFTSVSLPAGYTNQTTTIQPFAGTGAASICGSAVGVSGPSVLAILGGYPNPAAGGTVGSIGTAAPAGITISQVSAEISQSGPIGQDGWYTGDAYQGGGDVWSNSGGDGTSDPSTGTISSSSWGIVLGCASTVASCASDPAGTYPLLNVTSAAISATESQAPAISSSSPADLFNETGYVWNPPEDPWNLPLTATDPSEVCSATAVIGGQSQTLENQAPNQDAWQQCADGAWSTTVDTRQYVPGDGTLPVALQATNAAKNTATSSRTIKVDNDPVTETLGTPNDSNPTVWVNHAVQVTASPSAGPSGVNSQSCTVDSGASFTYPAGGFAVDGDGTHTVSCTAANNAVDPQGAHNTATANTSIAIDEAAPQLAFAPINPANPDQIVANTSDEESGVAAASLTVQGPHATAARPVASSLVNGQLTADFNDGAKNGNYTFVATSCDQVGNCGSTSETLHFPIRLGTDQLMSFEKIVVPATTIHRQIKLAARTKTITRHEKVHGKVWPVKTTVYFGAQNRRVRVHVNTNRRCGHHTIHYRAHGRRHRRRVVACRKQMRPRVIAKHRRALGSRVKVYGRLLSTQGAPVADAPVQISTKPRYPQGTWTVARTVNTGPKGYWTTAVSGGPSRLIRARYLGSDTTEPATSRIRLTVPAKIRLRITARVLPWSHAIAIRGHLVGSYLPHDGVALRLLVRYSHAKQWTVLEALRTNKHGAFHFKWSYGGGRGVITYPFRIASTASETDYPYAAGSSRAVRVTFGRATPHHRTHAKRHAHKRRHRRQKRVR